MTPVQLGLMAVVGVACLASSVFLAKAAPTPRYAVLDTVYN